MILTSADIFQIAVCFIMTFSLGLKLDVSRRVKSIANFIWITSLIIVWAMILIR